jgi:hypothetical protein
MKRRSFVWVLMGALFGLRGLYGIRAASAANVADDDLLLVNGWIVRRSQVSKRKRVKVR